MLKRIKLSERVMPDYTKGEETVNMVTHIVGGALAVVALVAAVLIATWKHDVYAMAAGAIWGMTTVILYTMSSVYHGLRPDRMAKRVFQVIDHCAIYLMIAGTYTPLSLCALRPWDAKLGWIIFGVVWGLALLGIALNAIDLERYKIISMVLYLGMGWCIVATMRFLPQILGKNGTLFLILGGIAYTLGAVFYCVGGKRRYAHSLFHVFVVVGTVFHALCILLYVI